VNRRSGGWDLYRRIDYTMNVRLVILAWKEGTVALEINDHKHSIAATRDDADEFRALVQPIIDSIVFND